MDGHGEHGRLRTFFAGLGLGCHTDGAVFQGDAGISFRPPANGTVPDGYVDGWIERLKPAMGNLSALGLLDKVIPTPSHLLDRISPIPPPFFPVVCAFSPSRRGGSNEPQAGTQGWVHGCLPQL